MTPELCTRTLDALDHEVLVLDVTGSVIYANEPARRLLDAPLADTTGGDGLSAGAGLGTFLDLWTEPQDQVRTTLRRLAGGSVWQPLRLTRASGGHAGLHMNLRGRAFMVRHENTSALYVLVTHDLYRERSFEDHRRLIRHLNIKLAHGSRTETLLTSMLENEKRLRHELIHRVKNNLSLLTSLLRINASRSDEPEVRRQLEEMERRILSIGAVHELLDRTQETDFVRADQLIERICSELERALAPGTITIRRELMPVRLHISDATPLALIINELVTNALKHAFPETGGGNISINLRKNGVEKLEAVVQDNGVGMEIATGGAMQGKGGRILYALAEQLRGEIVQSVDQGTTWQLIFTPHWEEMETAH